MTAPTPTPDLNEVKDVETRVALIEIAAAWLGIAVPSVRDEFSIKIADAILSSGLVVPAAEVEETKRLLSDPNAVHINMLAGKIAKPSVEQIVHVYAGRIVPAHTVSDLAVMHMERYQAIADLAERDAQIARLREALVDAEEVLALVERPAFPDPRHHEEVKALGRRIGFGALMSTASAGWAEANRAEGYPDSGVFVAGPCIGTVHGTLRRIRAALGETKP